LFWCLTGTAALSAPRARPHKSVGISTDTNTGFSGLPFELLFHPAVLPADLTGTRFLAGPRS
jgi:hypothetical protein